VKKFAIFFGLFSFAALLGVGSALSQITEVTACFRDDKKNSKLNRVSSGFLPGKDCKNKETQVTLPTDVATSGLQDQIDEIKTELISSMIGGAHNLGSDKQHCEQDGTVDDVCISPLVEGEPNTCTSTVSIPNIECESGPISVDVLSTAFMGMYVTRGILGLDEFKVQQVLTASGAITHMAVSVDEGPGVSDASRYTLRINSAAAALFPGSNTNFECDINGTSAASTCEVTSASIAPCVPVEEGDTISIGMLFTPINLGSANITPARWNARFVEGGVCPTDL
jgi:hypothetical protein